MHLSELKTHLYANPLRKHLFLSGLAVTVFLVIYAAKSVIDGVSLGLMDQSYQNGEADTVDRIIDQAMQKDCQPFNVHVGDRKAYLVNLECVQATANPSSATNGNPVTTTPNWPTYIQGSTR